MSLGNVNLETQTGGGRARVSGAVQSKTIITLAVSPKGTPATIYNPASLGAAKSVLDTGQALEALATRIRSGLPNYVVPLNPGVDGDVGAVTHTGIDAGTVAVSVAPHRAITVKCTLGGTLATAKFRFSLDGGVTYGDEFTSSAGPWSKRVPGTYCTLTFAAATYVIDKTLTVSDAGTVTNGSGWVGVVTQASSPIDDYEVLVTIKKGGALGTATARISLDGGNTALPDAAIPTAGVVVVPGTGLVLTFASTFTADETYEFVAAGPGPSTQDLDDALDAIAADQTLRGAIVHCAFLPATAAGAITTVDALQTALEALEEDGVDWQGVVECPRAGDIVVSGGAAIYDTADTDSAIRTARLGADAPLVALHAGTHRITSPITKRKMKRPTGWAIIARLVDKNPRVDPSRNTDGPLNVFAIGTDEAQATVGLDDVQINTLRTYREENGAFLSITNGGFGWKNLTLDADLQWATGVRVLNAGKSYIRTEARRFLGETPLTNTDGTIEEGTRRAWTAKLTQGIKRFYGLEPGGDFNGDPQVSFAEATVLAGSQLGDTPHRLDIEYVIVARGFISNVAVTVRYSGTLSVEA